MYSNDADDNNGIDGDIFVCVLFERGWRQSQNPKILKYENPKILDHIVPSSVDAYMNVNE